MKLARITAWLLALGVLLSTPSLARAEVITLQDGQQIVGTIVGYEKDMFRVETDYGIALIRKDKVVSIEVSRPQTTSAPTPSTGPKKPIESKPTQPAAMPGIPPTTPEPPHASLTPSSTSTKPTTAPATSAAQFPGPGFTAPKPSEARPVSPPPRANPPAAASAITPVPPQISPPPTSAIKLQEPATIAIKPPPSPPLSHPIDVPLPAHLEDHLDGNTYFSDTFHFSMYKPPDWKIFEGVTKETGSGIMAMGTDDEQTVLIIDRQVWSGTPKLSSEDVEAKFRQTYQDYRQISRESTQCAGQPATRTRFTGSLDGAEWHGVAIHLIRGNMVFGITGVTSAETFGFQEAIFNKIVNSLSFLSSAEPVSASSKP